MTDFLTNADHWRKRAEQTRALAANAVKDQGRLLKVAEEYDRLAAHAEQLGELRLRRKQSADLVPPLSDFLGKCARDQRVLRVVSRRHQCAPVVRAGSEGHSQLSGSGARRCHSGRGDR